MRIGRRRKEGLESSRSWMKIRKMKLRWRTKKNRRKRWKEKKRWKWRSEEEIRKRRRIRKSESKRVLRGGRVRGRGGMGGRGLGRGSRGLAGALWTNYFLWVAILLLSSVWYVNMCLHVRMYVCLCLRMHISLHNPAIPPARGLMNCQSQLSRLPFWSHSTDPLRFTVFQFPFYWSVSVTTAIFKTMSGDNRQWVG